MAAVVGTPPRRTWWSSRWTKLGLSVLLLAVLLHETDLGQLRTAVEHAHVGWVVLALLGFLVSQAVSAFRWKMLARPLGFDEPFSHFFGAYFTGIYMNLFAPSTVAGDIGRALLLSAGQKRKALAFTTVIADRGLGFVVLIWIGAIAILTHPGYKLPVTLRYAAWVIPPATLLGWLYAPPLMVRVFTPDNRWRQLVERDLAPYWSDFRLLAETSAVGCVLQFLQITTQLLLAWALDLNVPAPFFFIFVPVVNIAGMLPISFSGIGIREAGYWFFLAMVGVMRPAAVALGLLSSAVVLATGIISGLVFLLWNTPLPAAANSKGSGAANNTP